MKAALVLVCLVALTYAEPPVSGGYSDFNNQRGSPSRSVGGFSSGSVDNSQASHTPQTFKNVYVYSAPDTPTEQQSRVIRVPGGDKHVNIIFVKTPSSSSQQQTEVILPEQDEHKNLVYVLLKKSEASSDVRITRPQARPQSKPEVNFIRYQDSQQSQNNPAPIPSTQYGAPQAPLPVIRTPSQTYGF